jgi:CheY-like chemotaxis protein
MARVVIINDEPDLIEMCEIVLEAHGHAVRHTVAPHRMSELLDLEKWHPDLVLLDLVMPNASGDEVMHRLRSLPGTAHVPVMIMSAIPEGESKARELGAVGFLEKPFDPDGLVHAVNKAIAHDRAPGSRRHDSAPDSVRQDSQR